MRGGHFRALLAGTRLLRGEEEAGRWEILLGGQTTRRRATAGAIAGLGGGVLVLWAGTAATAVAAGRLADPPFSVTGSMFLALTTVAPAALFMAVGALCSQLAGTRRQAAWIAGAVFGAAYALRVVAYSGTSLRWVRWTTPLGWVDELRPLMGSRPLALVPILAAIVVLVAVAIILAGRRDLGAAIVRTPDTATAHTRLLTGPLGLAYRLARPTALGWIAGLAAAGLLLGTTAKTAADVMKNASGGVLEKLAGANGGAAFLGVMFLLVALLVAMIAAGQVAAIREEEADGYLDHLLVRPVARLPWLAGRFAVSAGMLIAAAATAGLATWAGTTITGAGISGWTLLAAGINVVPVGIVVLGAGVLIYGLAPRRAAAVAYGLVAWSFLIEIIGAAGIPGSRWLLDLSVMHHIARAPATDPRWDSALLLIGLGIVAAGIGAAAFARRDLKGA